MAELASVTLPGGERVPALGQGTWHMGESRRRAEDETTAIRLGIELGMTLIDTAELYGNGGAEEMLAPAIAGVRDRLFIVSKVLPYNASKKSTIAACEKSLRRLGTGHIDLYLLHWRGSHAFAETLEAFLELQRQGKIRYHGVSNLDRRELEEWAALPGGDKLATDQILYNLARRGPEWDLVPWCRERQVPVMAYTPLGQGSFLKNPALGEIARRHACSPARVALAWLLARPQTIVIPKATSLDHVRDNRAALDLLLTSEDFAALDRAFPPPKGKTALGML